MSIFSFNEDYSIGEVRSVESSRLTIRVTDSQKLQKARVGRLVAIQALGDEWIIGMIEKVWRKPIELTEIVNEDEFEDDEIVPIEENGISISLVGTYRSRDGKNHNVFSRAIFCLPEINRPVFPIEDKFLEDFMGIISASAKNQSYAPLKLGTYTLDGKANAFIDGNKLFQRHAALLGSTGSGKSFTVASILEQAAKLKDSNIIVFDLHGEYSTMNFAKKFKIAGPNENNEGLNEIIYLPFWLLNFDEMQSIFVDRSGENAPNQAIALMDSIIETKKNALAKLEKNELYDGFTVDTPIPFNINELLDSLENKNNDEKETGDFYATGAKKGQPKTEKGPLHGKLSRFLIRLKTKINDRRYAFMYKAPPTYDEYSSLFQIAEKLLGFGEKNDSINSGIKIIDFSEVPSDILPVVISLVARIVYQIQFWTDPGENSDMRHPVVMVCDEAHLYLPNHSSLVGPMEKRALENFEKIAKEGRKYGVGLFVVSQRPSDVSTTILSQCSNIISMRLSNKTDQSVVKQLLPESLESLMEVLPTLDVGEAVVVGDATLLPTRIKMDKPQHEPRSATVPFWERWSAANGKVDLNQAVENLRMQSRVKK
ncbi:hypothetical protein SAMN05428971_0055 [Candidatus Pantoea varia]|uniref:Helicase HerA central domain-containing protein n=1 Tax=Candidatus Pantoea varia TaxID=1881036 RepID=A0A1I4W9F7_9GAMM|nr:ATP-binding protein [Pantoea varia]SFN09952.1 hypothetical protein SAMN05428971_0055 [Pantoea varia]